jgi:HB1, ASXL, restriction endonuclease HTH domain
MSAAAKEDAMPDATNPFEAALNKLLQERAELDILIAAMQKRLGKPAMVPLSGLLIGGGPESSSASKPVYRGEFFNLSVTKAAEKALKRSGRPLKTPELLQIFEQAGYVVKGKTPRASVYTALARSRDFVKVLPDTWDLSERHPEAAAQKEQELREARASKGSKRKRSKSVRATKPVGTEELQPLALKQARVAANA